MIRMFVYHRIRRAFWWTLCLRSDCPQYMLGMHLRARQRRHSQIFAGSIYAISDLRDLNKYINKTEPTFFKRAPCFSLRKCNHGESKVAEEYCWAITWSAWRSYSGRSSFGVRSALFWDITRRMVVFPYRLSGQPVGLVMKSGTLYRNVARKLPLYAA